jgi:hypothetical protein
MPQSRQFICGATGYPMPPDCLQRGLREGSRRFDYMVSASSTYDYFGGGVLALGAARSVRRVFVLLESWALTILAQQLATCKQLGLELVGSQVVPKFAADWAVVNTTLDSVSERIRATQPDLVMFCAGFPTPVLFDLLRHWRDTDWQPRMMAYVCNGQVHMPQDLQPFMLTESLWLPSLTGSQYHALWTDSKYVCLFLLMHTDLARWCCFHAQSINHRPSIIHLTLYVLVVVSCVCVCVFHPAPSPPPSQLRDHARQRDTRQSRCVRNGIPAAIRCACSREHIEQSFRSGRPWVPFRHHRAKVVGIGTDGRH